MSAERTELAPGITLTVNQQAAVSIAFTVVAIDKNSVTLERADGVQIVAFKGDTITFEFGLGVT